MSKNEWDTIKNRTHAAIYRGLNYAEFLEENPDLKDSVKMSYFRDQKSILRQQGLIDQGPPAPTLEEVLGDTYVQQVALDEKTKTEQAALKAENKRLRAALGDFHTLLSELQVGLQVEAPPLPKPNRKHSGIESTLILPLYDVHIGHVVHTPITHYDPDIFAQRCVDLSKRIIDDINGSKRNFERLVIIFGGDIIEGRTIFKGQAKESVPIHYQLVRGPEVLVNGLLAPLIKEFPKVDIFAVPGNHGRLGEKNELEAVEDNLDIVFAETVKLRLQNADHVNWHEPENMFSYFQLYGYNYLASHGDGFKSWSGTPFYGATRYRSKLQDVLHSMIDVLMVGHHHTPADFGTGFGKVVMMNNWVGSNDYSVKMALGGQASQKVLIADPTNPVTTVHEYRFNDGAETQTIEPIRL